MVEYDFNEFSREKLAEFNNITSASKAFLDGFLRSCFKIHIAVSSWIPRVSHAYLNTCETNDYQDHVFHWKGTVFHLHHDLLRNLVLFVCHVAVISTRSPKQAVMLVNDWDE